MTTVQLATTNREYAFFLRSVLVRRGEYQVVIIDKPDPRIPGLLVVADTLLDDLNRYDPVRLIVIASRHDTAHLNRFWDAGLRNVIFAEDSLQTAYLAIVGAHMRLRAGQRTNCPILSAGDTSLGQNGLLGPFALTDTVIDQEVNQTSAGAFALDDSENGTSFHVLYVGRSDSDVNAQLHVYVGTYKRFKFVYCSSPRDAFEKECGLFHDFDPYDNGIHPLRPPGSNWTCPRCKFLG